MGMRGKRMNGRGLNPDKIAKVLCGAQSVDSCNFKNGCGCSRYGKCRIAEKTDSQLEYVVSGINECTYLQACAGSGKTEVLGMKAAYEMVQWGDRQGGIAVLAFTNAATDTIRDRINGFYSGVMPSKHFVGTLSSFIHGFIGQKFGYTLQVKDKKDMSFTLVDSAEDVYKKNWLKNYGIPLTNQCTFFANKLYKRKRDGEWFVRIRRRGNEGRLESLKDIYESHKRETRLSYCQLTAKAEEAKTSFRKDGFATFEDMTDIALECLQNKDILSVVAKKFPLIFVDECQDLSYAELEVLKTLNSAGSIIHFIGDINQAIYSFKDSDPKDLEKLIGDKGLKTYRLNENFRSTQNIVDAACRIQGIGRVEGKEKSKTDGRDAVYIEYEDINSVIDKFIDITDKLEISNRVVLVRTNKFLDRINGSADDAFSTHRVITAIKLWQKQTPFDMWQALQSFGIQLRRWLGYHVTSDSCPKEFDGSALDWRLRLRDILNSVCTDTTITYFADKTYSEWYRSVKGKLAHIIYENLKDKFEFNEIELKNSIVTPKYTGDKKIVDISNSNNAKIAAKTIHSAKGESYDAVLFLSDIKRQGKNTDHFGNWLSDTDEERRCAYVAATRPRYLLCLGLPTLSDEQREKFKQLGFTKYS